MSDQNQKFSELKNGDIGKSPDIRFSSKIEQASEITMTPALYHRTM